MTATAQPASAYSTDYVPEGSTQMLIYEHLARSRMREAEQAARKHRLVRGLLRARRWEKVSTWAARRAREATPAL